MLPLISHATPLFPPGSPRLLPPASDCSNRKFVPRHSSQVTPGACCALGLPPPAVIPRSPSFLSPDLRICSATPPSDTIRSILIRLPSLCSDCSSRYSTRRQYFRQPPRAFSLVIRLLQLGLRASLCFSIYSMRLLSPGSNVCSRVQRLQLVLRAHPPSLALISSFDVLLLLPKRGVAKKCVYYPWV